MRFGDMFLHVAAAVFAGGLTLHSMYGGKGDPPGPADLQRPPKVDEATAPDGWTISSIEVRPMPDVEAAPLPSDLPAPRGPEPRPMLAARLTAAGFTMGAPVFLRIIKAEDVVEVWMKKGARFELFEAFPICFWSGDLGPKMREGDGQSPEGFYLVSARQLNPHSAYHLAFNLGYPNAYDRAQRYTGAHLMVHGNCVSIGCYAMTDYGITEIYRLVGAALANGQRAVPVHSFPFRMTEANLAAVAGAPHLAFWRDLKPGWDAFEASRLPPDVFVCDGRYTLEGGAACDRVAAW